MLEKAVMRAALRICGVITATVEGWGASKDKPITTITKLGPGYSLLAVQPDQIEVTS